MQARLGVKAHTHKSSIKMLTYSESPLYTMLVGQWLLFLNPVLCPRVDSEPVHEQVSPQRWTRRRMVLGTLDQSDHGTWI